MSDIKENSNVEEFSINEDSHAEVKSPVTNDIFYHPRDKANDDVAKNIALWIFVLLGTIIGAGLLTLAFFSFFNISNDKILDITEKLLISSLTAISGIAGSAVAFYFTYNRNK